MEVKSKQIAVIGSMGDKKLESSVVRIAKAVGYEIAKNNAILLFGWEGDFLSLPVIAAIEAEKNNGKTIAFLWSAVQGNNKLKSMTVQTGQLRGGGREYPLILSADVIISIGGGSGTLMEMTMAYQAGIPIIALKNTGGWSHKLAGMFLDDRKRSKIIAALDARDAVQKAINQIK